MNRVVRNVTDREEGFLNGSCYLILDRDPLLTTAFREILRFSGVETVKLATRSPNVKTYAERFVRSIKSECLNQIILLGERHLRHAVEEYTEPYDVERNHEGLDHRLIDDRREVVDIDSEVERRRQWGGLLNEYFRRAA